MNAGVSLIVTTYNWPAALSLVLESAIKQTVKPNEIIVADDGSRLETRQLIERIRKSTTIPILHAWQEDLGFRVARARNQALLLAKRSYIVFVDGDTILHPAFIQDHLVHREINTFVIGSRVLLGSNSTANFLTSQKFCYNYITTEASNRLNALYFPTLSRCLAKKRKEPVEKLIFQVRSCNFACHYQDLIAVNGFNEAFEGWGREDSELALRLLRKGLWLKSIKLSAIQYHLHHPERSKESLGKNQALLDTMKRTNTYRCKHGLNKL
ncbi:MAG: glycosyltransferase family 2 protein [Neisseriaceae bacterium]